jgi:hypothetical protein
MVLMSAASAAPLDAFISRSGEITIKEADAGKTIAAITPGIYEKGWKFDGSTSAQAETPNSDISGFITTSGGQTISVHGAAKVQGDAIQFVYTLTPSADITINSAQVSVHVPCTTWIGGAWIAGNANGIIPESAKETSLYSGGEHALTLKKGNALIKISDSNLPVMLQDNRVFSSNDLEMRIGQSGGNDQIWPAGENITISFTFSAGRLITLKKEIPMVIKANQDWIPLQDKMTIEPGSALDFSSLSDAPAGKHGWVIAAPDGHFAFSSRPDHSVRLYGANLCFSANYPDHADADILAKHLQQIGYNTVRIHHYESELTDANAPNSLTFRKDSQDKLNYLIAALKKHGIYVMTDLFVSRPIRPDEAPGDNFKMAVLVSQKAMDNWKAFSKELLDQVNPYTGLAWKDDPEIAFLSLINEPNIPANMDAVTGSLKPEFESAWKSWLKERYGSDTNVQKAWNDPSATTDSPMPTKFDQTPQGLDFAVFATYLHERAWNEMSEFLRKEIKTRALLTYLNGWAEIPPLMAARTDFNWVDNHFYWDHPRFLVREWNLPSEGSSGGGSAIDAGGAGPNYIAGTRLWDKPFSVSEYNYAAPNPFRAEGGLLMGAGSALQDWGAVWRFAWAHDKKTAVNGNAVDYFNMAGDPAGLASERAAVMLFLREDMAPAKKAVTLVRTHDELIDHPKAETVPNIADLTWKARVGVRIVDQKHPLPIAGKDEVRLRPGDKLPVLPVNPQCQIDADNGMMTINTPRTEGGVAHAGDTLHAGHLTARIEGARAALWASSLDGRPLYESRRILLIHVTDVENTDMHFAGPDKRVLESWGKLPHLVREGQADVTLKTTLAGKLKAWRLDQTGKRIEEISLKREKDQISLHIDIRDKNNNAGMYYEIAEK